MSNTERIKLPNLALYPTSEAKCEALAGCLQSVIQAVSGDLDTLRSEDISDFDDRVNALIEERAQTGEESSS